MLSARGGGGIPASRLLLWDAVWPEKGSSSLPWCITLQCCSCCLLLAAECCQVKRMLFFGFAFVSQDTLEICYCGINMDMCTLLKFQ